MNKTNDPVLPRKIRKKILEIKREYGREHGQAKLHLLNRILKSHTHLVKSWGGGWTPELRVGVQGFRLEYGASKEEAEWMRLMLAKALVNFLEANGKELMPMG